MVVDCWLVCLSARGGEEILLLFHIVGVGVIGEAAVELLAAVTVGGWWRKLPVDAIPSRWTIFMGNLFGWLLLLTLCGLCLGHCFIGDML